LWRRLRPKLGCGAKERKKEEEEEEDIQLIKGFPVVMESYTSSSSSPIC
jgi:hypothetical protein